MVCPAKNIDVPLQVFDGLGCRTARPIQIDSHKTIIWVKGTVELPAEILESPKAAFAFLSVEGSSRIYVNGYLIGTNGVPARTKAEEDAGQLDAAIFIPRQFLNEGENTLTVLLSGHHSRIALSHTIHRFGIGFDINPQHRLMQSYWPSMLTFGVFIIGGFYFAAVSLFRRRTFENGLMSSVALSAASFFAAGQLIVEVLRGVWAYPYSFHELRLGLIVSLSISVGASLVYHTLCRFGVQRRGILLGLTVLVMLAVVLLIPGFDNKASCAILVATLSAATIALVHFKTQSNDAVLYGGAFLSFSLLNVLAPQQFLDSYYYFALALLLLTLFLLQARLIWSFERNFVESDLQRRQLETVLDELSSENERFLIIDSNGRRERLSLEDIAFISGAGDYVAINLVSGKEILHSTSLSTLEGELPLSFLRVHRSHIVNTVQIRSLDRHTSGTGELSLNSGVVVPVSRRIMPRVRQRLDVNPLQHI